MSVIVHCILCCHLHSNQLHTYSSLFIKWMVGPDCIPLGGMIISIVPPICCGICERYYYSVRSPIVRKHRWPVCICHPYRPRMMLFCHHCHRPPCRHRRTVVKVRVGVVVVVVTNSTMPMRFVDYMMMNTGMLDCRYDCRWKTWNVWTLFCSHPMEG